MQLSIPAFEVEKNLIEACVRKENWALKVLYETYYSAMMQLCRCYADNHEEALDILHNGFIKIFKSIHQYEPGTSLHAWMRRVMINTAIDFYRSSMRRKTEDLDFAYQLASPDADVISAMNAEDILDCVQQLPVSYRSVFNLNVVEGYSHKEISVLLGITESTSRAHLVKARNKLKALIFKKNNLNE